MAPNTLRIYFLPLTLTMSSFGRDYAMFVFESPSLDVHSRSTTNGQHFHPEKQNIILFSLKKWVGASCPDFVYFPWSNHAKNP